MKKLSSTIVVIACLGMVYDAYAAGSYTCSRSTTPPSGMGATTSTMSGCTGTTTWYYITYNGSSMADTIASCSACGTGYDREAVQATGSSGVYNICSNVSSMISGLYKCTSKTCTDCTSDTSWVGTGTTGYLKKTTATCNSGVCNKTTAYQCNTGYYGTPTSGTSGCTQCPAWTGVYRDSSLATAIHGYTGAGATAITSCMMLPTITYYDASGTFNLTNTCSYSNSN